MNKKYKIVAIVDANQSCDRYKNTKIYNTIDKVREKITRIVITSLGYQEEILQHLLKKEIKKENIILYYDSEIFERLFYVSFKTT
ncbi:MAG: hypothetical protein AB1765_12215 [Candidatus Hydrogenedentota bacterium]